MTAHDDKTKPHILPLSLYLTIGGALLVLTAVTVLVSFFQFGAYNLVVAMFIAAIKATLVALFFMHLKYDNKVYLLVFVLAILFLAAFIIFTMFDTMQRDQIYRIKSGPIDKDAIIYETQTGADSTSVEADSTANRADTVTIMDEGH
ncbi:MAG: cytochrome C oxidase subunit IV family protein [candidate division Zixibacteria bacterium]|nr:cytochrome C oxidase subunit IV family protein [candidate division Zixibacteria bacterium]MDH3935994.1 cytochrome C oxidase subunit IV family protein [candidate division Zixibacteria bacterium]MDH4032588.1 cytochrome C oxidase subunit IV family protein [candidate division Zixibacteria bacterium]